MKAQAILQCAISVMEERAKQYDKPEGERSIPAVVEAFNAITGKELTPADGWLFMVLLKLVRAQTADRKPLFDRVEDGAAYLALMGEEMTDNMTPFMVGDPNLKPGPMVKVPSGTVPWPTGPVDAHGRSLVEDPAWKAEQERRNAEARDRLFRMTVKSVDCPHGGFCLPGSKCTCDPVGQK